MLGNPPLNRDGGSIKMKRSTDRSGSSRGKTKIAKKSPLLPLVLLTCGFSLVFPAVQEVSLSVEGMACLFCARGVEESLSRLPGVGLVEADAVTGRVRVQAEAGQALSLDEIRARIHASGFRPRGEAVLRLAGTIHRGRSGRLTFEVASSSQSYDLLEGEELRHLLLSLPVTSGALVALTARLHEHPGPLPPSLSVLSYEVKTP